MIATVTTKGQVTIPKSIRDRLRIKANDRIDFAIEEGRAVLVPVRTLKDLRGAVPAKAGFSSDRERRSAKAAAGKRVRAELA
ncbi:MAG TPA: AbrB/MazE/SpoVT family DNA-binding domain-containing protein [bacterium]